MMERSEILTAMVELKLYRMKTAFDEIIATAVKRQHEPQRIVGDLLTAEISPSAWLLLVRPPMTGVRPRGPCRPPGLP